MVTRFGHRKYSFDTTPVHVLFGGNNPPRRIRPAKSPTSVRGNLRRGNLRRGNLRRRIGPSFISITASFMSAGLSISTHTAVSFRCFVVYSLSAGNKAAAHNKPFMTDTDRVRRKVCLSANQSVLLSLASPSPGVVSNRGQFVSTNLFVVSSHFVFPVVDLSTLCTIGRHITSCFLSLCVPPASQGAVFERVKVCITGLFITRLFKWHPD